MNNLVLRSISGAVLVWLVLECTASEGVWYYVLWGAIFALSIGELFSLTSKSSLKRKNMWQLGGVLYIALAAFLVYLLRGDRFALISLLTMVWANDVGAYLVGVSIGKHKMAPKISPKKSWEGFFGGLFFAVLTAICWHLFYFLKIFKVEVQDISATTQIILWGVLGLFVGLAAVVGDLIESAFKRKLGVKDSGNIIPGHGGMLDRFDALFLALPVFYVIYEIINQIIHI